MIMFTISEIDTKYPEIEISNQENQGKMNFEEWEEMKIQLIQELSVS